jgi:hypothetical protein
MWIRDVGGLSKKAMNLEGYVPYGLNLVLL